MLSLMSSSTPTLTGVRLSENCVTGCGSPSSKTSKSSLREAGDQAVVAVGDGDGDFNGGDAAAEGLR